MPETYVEEEKCDPAGAHGHGTAGPGEAGGSGGPAAGDGKPVHCASGDASALLLLAAGAGVASGGAGAGRGPSKYKGLVLERTFWEVFGWPGASLVLSFAVGAATLVWLVVNGFRVYVYSKNLDVDDKIVTSLFSAGYDYSNQNEASERETIVNGVLLDDETYGAQRLSGYDFLYTDNYKYTRWKNTCVAQTAHGGLGTPAPGGALGPGGLESIESLDAGRAS